MATAMTPSHQRKASASRLKTPPPRPTTPLRPPSRSSLRSSHTPTNNTASQNALTSPLSSLEPAFAELSDGMADLEANFMHLQLMHESLARFSECFASFLYGLNVNAFCVDFPEAPVSESFRRVREEPQFLQTARDDNATYMYQRAPEVDKDVDPDQTFLTTDTSFVDNPPSTIRSASTASRYSRSGTARGTSRGSTLPRGARGGTASSSRGSGSRGKPSGLARATTRGRGVSR